MIASFAGVFFWMLVVAAVLGPVAAALVFRRLKRSGWLKLAWAFLFCVGLVWALGVWSTFIEPERLVIRRETIPLARWSGPPLTVGLIADSHVGAPHMSPARMARIVQVMNAQHPDLILLLGDYVGGHQQMTARSAYRNAQVLGGIAALKDLKAPLGVIGVIGNHDYWYDKRAVRDALKAANATVVDNSATLIHRPGGDFWVVGLADLQDIQTWHAVKPAYKGVPDGATSILVAHEPDAFEAPGEPYAIMLAGHTHCGQVLPPFLGPIGISTPLERQYACHLYRRGDQALYVSGGLGVSGPPMRYDAPPEINILTLTGPAPATGAH